MRTRSRHGVAASRGWIAALPVLYSTFSALVGTQSVLFSKTLAVLLRATFGGDNQARRGRGLGMGPGGCCARCVLLALWRIVLSAFGAQTRQRGRAQAAPMPLDPRPGPQFKSWFIYLVIPCFALTAVFWITRLNKVGVKGALWLRERPHAEQSGVTGWPFHPTRRPYLDHTSMPRPPPAPRPPTHLPRASRCSRHWSSCRRSRSRGPCSPSSAACCTSRSTAACRRSRPPCLPSACRCAALGGGEGGGARGLWARQGRNTRR